MGVPSDCVVLPRHKQQELLELLQTCREIVPKAQRVVKDIAALALQPQFLKLQTATINDADEALKYAKRIDDLLAAAITYVKHLEQLTIAPPEGPVM